MEELSRSVRFEAIITASEMESVVNGLFDEKRYSNISISDGILTLP